MDKVTQRALVSDLACHVWSLVVEFSLPVRLPPLTARTVFVRLAEVCCMLPAGAGSGCLFCGRHLPGARLEAHLFSHHPGEPSRHKWDPAHQPTAEGRVANKLVTDWLQPDPGHSSPAGIAQHLACCMHAPASVCPERKLKLCRQQGQGFAVNAGLTSNPGICIAGSFRHAACSRCCRQVIDRGFLLQTLQADGASEGRTVPEGYTCNNVLASYVHVHFASCPEAARALVERCRQVDIQALSQASPLLLGVNHNIYRGSDTPLTPPGRLARTASACVSL